MDFPKVYHRGIMLLNAGPESFRDCNMQVGQDNQYLDFSLEKNIIAM
jgi:hypothetical protein